MYMEYVEQDHTLCSVCSFADFQFEHPKEQQQIIISEYIDISTSNAQLNGSCCGVKCWYTRGSGTNNVVM